MNQRHVDNFGLRLAIGSAKYGIENGEIEEGDKLRIDGLMNYVTEARYLVEARLHKDFSNTKPVLYFTDIISLVNNGKREVRTENALRKISNRLGEIISQLGHVRDNPAGSIQNETGLISFLDGLEKVVI